MKTIFLEQISTEAFTIAFQKLMNKEMTLEASVFILQLDRELKQKYSEFASYKENLISEHTDKKNKISDENAEKINKLLNEKLQEKFDIEPLNINLLKTVHISPNDLLALTPVLLTSN